MYMYSCITSSDSSCDSSEDQSVSIQLSDETIVSDVNMENVTLSISRQDYMVIKKASPIATSLPTTYLGITSSTADDIAGNEITPLSQRSYSVNCITELCILKAQKFTKDTVVPSLEALYIVRDGSTPDTAVAYFNDVVYYETANINNFVLYSTSKSVILGTTGGQISNTAIDYFLNIDITSIMLDGIASSQPAANLYIKSAGSVRDVSPLLNGNDRMVQDIHGIREGNKIVSFRLDLSSNEMSLEFVYPMIPSSISIADFKLHTLDLSTIYVLTGYINDPSTVADDAPAVQYLTITISSSDSLQIQTYFPGIAKDDLFMTYQPAAITEKRLAGSPYLFELASTNVVNCTQIVTSAELPSLLSFSLDLDAGTLTLNFAKVSILDMSFTAPLSLFYKHVYMCRRVCMCIYLFVCLFMFLFVCVYARILDSWMYYTQCIKPYRRTHTHIGNVNFELRRNGDNYYRSS